MTTRASEIANYLLSVDFARSDEGLRAELIGEIVRRWPDVTSKDLTAAFQIAVLETQAQVARLAADRLERAARAVDTSLS